MRTHSRMNSGNIIDSFGRKVQGYPTIPGSTALGGMGNLFGAVFGAVALTALPELFRGLADYRYLFYGLALLLLIRFRPHERSLLPFVP